MMAPSGWTLMVFVMFNQASSTVPGTKAHLMQIFKQGGEWIDWYHCRSSFYRYWCLERKGWASFLLWCSNSNIFFLTSLFPVPIIIIGFKSKISFFNSFLLIIGRKTIFFIWGLSWCIIHILFPSQNLKHSPGSKHIIEHENLCIVL